jgi:hypothetical protein
MGNWHTPWFTLDDDGTKVCNSCGGSAYVGEWCFPECDLLNASRSGCLALAAVGFSVELLIAKLSCLVAGSLMPWDPSVRKENKPTGDP